jgi:hypothetical protein
MTMPKPEDDNNVVISWLRGVNPQSLVLCTIGLMTGYFAMGTRITVVEQNVPHLNEQVAANRLAIEHLDRDFVSKAQYNIDQQNLELQLNAIRFSQESILKLLAEGKGSR